MSWVVQNTSLTSQWFSYVLKFFLLAKKALNVTCIIVTFFFVLNILYSEVMSIYILLFSRGLFVILTQTWLTGWRKMCVQKNMCIQWSLFFFFFKSNVYLSHLFGFIWFFFCLYWTTITELPNKVFFEDHFNMLWFLLPSVFLSILTELIIYYRKNDII